MTFLGLFGLAKALCGDGKCHSNCDTDVSDSYTEHTTSINNTNNTVYVPTPVPVPVPTPVPTPVPVPVPVPVGGGAPNLPSQNYLVNNNYYSPNNNYNSSESYESYQVIPPTYTSNYVDNSIYNNNVDTPGYYNQAYLPGSVGPTLLPNPTPTSVHDYYGSYPMNYADVSASNSSMVPPISTTSLF
ncbi:hypothetical protein HMI54_013343 [Coelomomyces lativittatus]|nr:hypothetical protein HMI55_000422 [Coelomomyces lativittatus]KAJ1511146.1 hypothetical protein HMI56_005761 [Coelomomyces lativittatus]KAJ1514845.1 hypothetical protein HMI54_013343 [Coelomomyces lativittatus]